MIRGNPHELNPRLTAVRFGWHDGL
jgi:hypothetical protein